MWSICTPLLLVLVTFSTASDYRIIGGRNGTIEETPYQVAVLLNQNHHCGGSIITEDWVISCAHCFSNEAELYGIRIGSSLRNAGGYVHEVETVIKHESYGNPGSHSNNIAVVKVLHPFPFSAQVQPVALPSESAIIGAMGVMSGYGLLQWLWGPAATVLQIVELPIVSQEDCRVWYPGSQIHDHMLCAGFLTGSTGACEGDHGGPLVVDGVLHGVISWSINCGSLGHPIVFSDVFYYRNWIREKTEI